MSVGAFLRVFPPLKSGALVCLTEFKSFALPHVRWSWLVWKISQLPRWGHETTREKLYLQHGSLGVMKFYIFIICMKSLALQNVQNHLKYGAGSASMMRRWNWQNMSRNIGFRPDPPDTGGNTKKRLYSEYVALKSERGTKIWWPHSKSHNQTVRRSLPECQHDSWLHTWPRRVA